MCRFEVNQEHWSTQLARLLQGKSLEVYQRLSDADVGKYDVLKAQLLKWFASLVRSLPVHQSASPRFTHRRVYRKHIGQHVGHIDHVYGPLHFDHIGRV